MNNLFHIREKIQRTERLHQAKILAMKKGEVTPYRRSFYKERLKQAQIDLKSQDS